MPDPYLMAHVVASELSHVHGDNRDIAGALGMVDLHVIVVQHHVMRWHIKDISRLEVFRLGLRTNADALSVDAPVACKSVNHSGDTLLHLHSSDRIGGDVVNIVN